MPTARDIHEWEILRKFALAQEEHSDELLDAIHGAGAFRSFKAEIERLGLKDSWYTFRNSEFERIASDWLEENGILHECDKNA